MIYLDNGATTYPKPTIVKKAVMSYFDKYGANPGRGGYQMAMDTALKVYETREAVAEFFGCDRAENVVFTLNCTHASNMVINGLLKKGDHVIISDMEHNSVSRPVHKLFTDGVISYDIATTYTDDKKTVQSFLNLIKPNTKLIITTHASNVIGQVVPIIHIGRICKQKNIAFMVDAAQSAGVLDIDMERDNIDFLCIAGHKGLYATMGSGILIAGKPEMLSPTITGGSGSLSVSLTHPDFMPDMLESGTANTLGIISIGAGIKFVNSMGRDNLYQGELFHTIKLYNMLKENAKVRVYSPLPIKNRSVPVISFNVNGYSSEEVCERVSRMGICLRGGLHCSPLCHKKLGTSEFGTVRASLAAFNTEKDINFLVNTIKNL